MITALNDRAWLDRHYTDLAMSDRQIADLLGVPQHRVYGARQRLGIRSRPRGHNLKSGSGRRPDQSGERGTMFGKTGERAPNWKGGRSPLRQRAYNQTRYRQAVARSRERDGYRCRRCGSDDSLETHHEYPVESYPERIDDENNMITLCGKCHRWVHSRKNIYGVFLKGVREC